MMEKGHDIVYFVLLFILLMQVNVCFLKGAKTHNMHTPHCNHHLVGTTPSDVDQSETTFRFDLTVPYVIFQGIEHVSGRRVHRTRSQTKSKL